MEYVGSENSDYFKELTLTNDMIQQFGEFADGVMFWSVLRYGEALMEESEGNIKTSLFEGGYSMVDSKVVRKRIKAIADEFFKAYKGIDVTVVLSSSNPLTVYLAGVIGQRCVDPFFISDFLAKLYFEEVDDLIYEENSWFRKHYGDKYWERYEEFKNYSDKMIDPGFQFKKITDLEMRGVIEETIKSGDAFYAKYIDAINDKNVLVVEDRITLDGKPCLESWRLINTYYSPKSVSVMTIVPVVLNRNAEMT